MIVLFQFGWAGIMCMLHSEGAMSLIHQYLLKFALKKVLRKLSQIDERFLIRRNVPTWVDG